MFTGISHPYESLVAMNSSQTDTASTPLDKYRHQVQKCQGILQTAT